MDLTLTSTRITGGGNVGHAFENESGSTNRTRWKISWNTSPSAAVDDLIWRSVTASERWGGAILRLRIADCDGADSRELVGHAERLSELGLVRDAKEDRAEA